MCNETKEPSLNKDYRFIDYRLDQLEQNLSKGQERLEKEYKEQNEQIMKTLQIMQEGQNQQNQTLTELKQRVVTLEEKRGAVDKLKEVAARDTTRITELERRLDLYKVVIVGIVITVIGTVAVDLINFG